MELLGPVTGAGKILSEDLEDYGGRVVASGVHPTSFQLKAVA